MIETHFVFPRHAVAAAGPLPREAEALSLPTADGETLAGVRFRPSTGGSGTLILGFAGNAWNSQHAALFLHELYPDADVVAFHYRGYAPSTGTPSADALIADAQLVHDLAVEAVKPRRTIAVGFSIGSGVAAALAQKRPLDGLILVTPFDSLRAVVADHYPWLPVGVMFSNEIDAAGALARAKVPAAIIAAADDSLIPAKRTEGLRKAAKTLVFDRTIARSGHNDIYHRPQFRAAMREARDALTPSSNHR